MRSRLLLAVLLVATGLSACGGGDGGAGESTGAAADTGSVATVETQETTPAGTAAEAFQIKVPSSAPISSTSPPKRIRQLQTALAMLGYEVGEPDGVYGAQTEKAVIAFQKKKKLEADGLVGPQTARAINKALRQQAKKK